MGRRASVQLMIFVFRVGFFVCFVGVCVCFFFKKSVVYKHPSAPGRWKITIRKPPVKLFQGFVCLGFFSSLPPHLSNLTQLPPLTLVGIATANVLTAHHHQKNPQIRAGLGLYF